MFKWSYLLEYELDILDSYVADVDECLVNPCLNATCMNLNGAIEKTGQLCDADVDECLENPCLNGATCMNLNGSFDCVCAIGYTGQLCDADVDECLENACLSGATCIEYEW